MAILGTSIIAFLAIFTVCYWDYKRIPADEFGDYLENASSDLTTIIISILKLLIMSYAFYVISRQVISVSQTETIWTIGWNFPIVILISILSSVSVIFYIAVWKKTEANHAKKNQRYLLFCVAVLTSGFGHIVVAGVSSGAPLGLLGEAPLHVFDFSLVTGLILTVSARMHFDTILKLQNLPAPEVNVKITIDAFNAASTSVLSILLAAAFWTFVI